MELRYWVWLSLALGAGSHYAEDILRHFASPQDLYERIQSSSAMFPPLNSASYQKLRRTQLSQADAVLEQCAHLSIDVITPKDRDYPQRLLPISSPPLVLYKKGDISVLNQNVTVTVVGSRVVTSYGRSLAEQISYGLAVSGVVVASGMALGGDEAAHIGALTAGGTTVAVLGCGIDVDYPKEHRILKEQVLEKGALISEYAPGERAVGSHFPVRNRILSGIASGVLVVECSEHSGALITANHALDQGRDVFAVPGQVVGAPTGTFGLLRDGAVPVREAADILHYYHINVSPKAKPPRTKPAAPPSPEEPRRVAPSAAPDAEPVPAPAPAPVSEETLAQLSAPARKTYEILGDKCMGIDELSQAAALSARELFPVLTELELNGLIQALPGKRYSK